MVDQLAKYLNLINTVAIQSAQTSVNTAAGGSLAVDATIDSVALTAANGELEGLTFKDLSLGLEEVIPPTPTDPAIRLTPVVRHLVVEMAPALFARAAEVVGEPLAARAHEIVDRVVLDDLRIGIHLSADRVLKVDLKLAKVRLLQDETECVLVSDLHVIVEDFDLKVKDQKKALANTLVVIHSLRVEVLEGFLNSALKVGQEKAGPVTDLKIRLPGPLLVVEGLLKKSFLSASFNASVRLETRNSLFGIYVDRVAGPGNVPFPGARSLVLTAIKFVEKRLKGLVEVSDQSLMINPWQKVPVLLECKVQTFTVEKGRIIIEFSEVPGRKEGAVAPVRRAVLPPGPPI